MAMVTIELRNLLNIQEFDLFDFEYLEIYSGFKKEFEQKFIDYYYFEEIGVETPERFKQRLKSKLNIILPRYKTEFEKMSLLDDMTIERLTRTFTRSQDSDSTLSSTTQTTTQSENVNTDYPQYSSVTDDIPSNKSNDTSSADGSQRGRTDEQLNEAITETVTKEGGIKERTALIHLKNDVVERLIYELKTLFILIY